MKATLVSLDPLVQSFDRYILDIIPQERFEASHKEDYVAIEALAPAHTIASTAPVHFGLQHSQRRGEKDRADTEREYERCREYPCISIGSHTSAIGFDRSKIDLGLVVIPRGILRPFGDGAICQRYRYVQWRSGELPRCIANRDAACDVVMRTAIHGHRARALRSWACEVPGVCQDLIDYVLAMDVRFETAFMIFARVRQ